MLQEEPNKQLRIANEVNSVAICNEILWQGAMERELMGCADRREEEASMGSPTPLEYSSTRLASHLTVSLPFGCYSSFIQLQDIFSTPILNIS